MSDDAKKTWGEDGNLAFQVWKHYGSVGGRDKDTMIRTVTWLLGFSAAIVAFWANEEFDAAASRVVLPWLGIFVSILGVFTALLYGGYASRNWAVADRIAEMYNWTEQSPSYNPIPRAQAHWTAALSFWIAEPCTNAIAPVFWIYVAVSLVSLVVHAGLLFCAFR